MSEEQKLNDQIAFCNSIAQQFMAFRDTTSKTLANLIIKNVDIDNEIKELKTLIDANRSWIQICDSTIKELKKMQHIHKAPKVILDIKPTWKFWK